MVTTARRAIAGLASMAWLPVMAAVVATVPASAADLGHRNAPSEAAGLIRHAEHGDPRAETALCYMFYYGRDVPQSYASAFDWCTRAAHQGSPDAQYLLGLMYDKGFGVDSDVIKAYKWLNLAAAHAAPYDRANYNRIRDAVASKMTQDQLVIAQKLAVEFVVTRQ